MGHQERAKWVILSSTIAPIPLPLVLYALLHSKHNEKQECKLLLAIASTTTYTRSCLN